MPAGRAYKSDESFLQKISMGAIGTGYVFNNLEAQGHHPVELERGSQSFKIWKDIKIKRLRVPDILCTSCGHRFESRAKANFEISMSHSYSDPDREWNSSLSDDDYVAIVVCKKSGDHPIDWEPRDPVQYVNVGEMATAKEADRIKAPDAKGATEGFESRLLWPTAVANFPGTVTTVSTDYIKYDRDSDDRTIPLQRERKWATLDPLVTEGDRVVPNQVLASVVPVYQSIPCDGDASVESFIELLESPDKRLRYTACKALASLQVPTAQAALENRLDHPEEGIFVRLEAAKALVLLGSEAGWEFLEATLGGENLQHQLETVIVLGEIQKSNAAELLSEVLQDKDRHAEIRAGAAWGLGEIEDQTAIGKLATTFADEEIQVKVEAARALGKLTDKYTPALLQKFAEVDEDRRPGVAWALARSNRLEMGDLLEALDDEDARHWASYIVGHQGKDRFIEGIETLRDQDPEVYFGATLLWKLLSSWAFGLEEYG